VEFGGGERRDGREHAGDEQANQGLHTASIAATGDRLGQQASPARIPGIARWLLAWAVALHVGAAAAIGVVTVSDSWVQPARANGSTSVYFVLGSSVDTALVGARSDAGEVRLARGKASVDAIDVAAGQPLAMSARGPHVVIRKLSRRLALGDRVTLTLSLRDAQGNRQEIPVDAEVRHRSPLDDERRAHAHGEHKH
jgi:hypothetical protein